jgi:hypothetical protein
VIVRVALLGVCVGALLTSGGCAKKAYEQRIVSETVVVREKDDRKSGLESLRDTARRLRADPARHPKDNGSTRSAARAEEPGTVATSGEQAVVPSSASDVNASKAAQQELDSSSTLASEATSRSARTWTVWVFWALIFAAAGLAAAIVALRRRAVAG